MDTEGWFSLISTYSVDQFVEKYGGHYFPFIDCDMRFIRDQQIINNLKETSCNMHKVGRFAFRVLLTTQKLQWYNKSFNVYSDHRGTGLCYSINISVGKWMIFHFSLLMHLQPHIWRRTESFTRRSCWRLFPSMTIEISIP